MDFKKLIEQYPTLADKGKKCDTKQELDALIRSQGMGLESKELDEAFEYLKNNEIGAICELNEDDMASVAGGKDDIYIYQ